MVWPAGGGERSTATYICHTCGDSLTSETSPQARIACGNRECLCKRSGTDLGAIQPTGGLGAVLKPVSSREAGRESGISVAGELATASRRGAGMQRFETASRGFLPPVPGWRWGGGA